MTAAGNELEGDRERERPELSAGTTDGFSVIASENCHTCMHCGAQSSIKKKTGFPYWPEVLVV